MDKKLATSLASAWEKLDTNEDAVQQKDGTVWKKPFIEVLAADRGYAVAATIYYLSTYTSTLHYYYSNRPTLLIVVQDKVAGRDG